MADLLRHGLLRASFELIKECCGDAGRPPLRTAPLISGEAPWLKRWEHRSKTASGNRDHGPEGKLLSAINGRPPGAATLNRDGM